MTVAWLPYVALAAAAGGVIRWLLALRANRRFPVGTLVANVVACFALGVVDGLEEATSIILGIGFLGALSTWSSLAGETHGLWQSGRRADAAGYLGVTLIGGVAAAAAGLALG